MYFSKYNIFGKLKGSDNYFLLNPLTNNADILTPQKAGEIFEGSYSDTDEYIQKGYLIDEKEEQRLYKLKYLDFIEERDNSEVQIFFVPWYECNFACSYCYQDGYALEKKPLTDEVIDAFFNYIKDKFSHRKKYVTVFGGEPLLPGNEARSHICKIIERSAAEGIALAFVTNGYALLDYLDDLSKGIIREIQVTLDGTADVHDKRRFLKGGGATFEKIARGIDSALERGFTVNLRIVADKENIEGLSALAEFAINRGWTKNPNFKTQIGRNYELHVCQSDNGRLFDRAGLYEKIYEIIEQYPPFLEFHKPAYSISRFLADNGRLPEPFFDSCPGCKTEWAFDYSGKIFPCTATVGKAGEEIGSFYPEVSIRGDAVSEWESRDVTSIPECADCGKQLLCGGGCASVAKNKTGKIHAPDCRPVKELLEMGISLYLNKGD